MSADPLALVGHVSVSPGSELQAEWITDVAAFTALTRDWNTLVETIPSHSLFLRHEWFDAAWQWRCRDASLAVLCLRRQGRLVGVAPLIRSTRRRQRIAIRCLEFLTVPDTQFCDILAAPEERVAVATAVAQALRGAPFRWDAIDLNRLPADSFTNTALPSRLTAIGLPCYRYASEINLYIDLAQTWQTFYAQRSRRLKKANNLVANRLQRAAKNVDIERTPNADQPATALTHAADTAIALSAQSWKHDTGVSLDQPGPGNFLRRLVDRAQGNNWLSIWLLRLDQSPVAMELQVAYNGQVHALRSDFAESYKTLSPGAYLNWKLLESLFDRGLRRYWFGPGANSYKLHWTDVGEPLYTVTIYGLSLRGRWLRFLETTLRPWMKTILGREKATSPPMDAPPS